METQKILDDISRVTGVKYSEEQERILRHEGGMCILACAGSGKALVNGTEVLTPRGYQAIETLKVGDICYNENGEEQQVVGVYPQGKKEVYTVKFKDGAEIKCCREHLWTYKEKESNEWKTDTLEKMIGLGSISIPVVKPIEFNNKQIDNAYEVGILVGNSEIVDKEILNEYKYSSIETRVEFLRGIIDSKELLYNNGYKIELNKNISEDIKFIAETLGLVVSIVIGNEKDELNIEALNRLDKDYVDNYKEREREIIEIVKTEELEEMTCIKVSSDSGLFVTENCVVTHNTTILTHLLAKRILSGEIVDTNKLLCTTYSKAGADEMEERINKLFKRLGINKSITVKTLHAFYYMMLKHFGINANVIDNKTRLRFILEATKEASVKLGDEDLQTIDSLLSFQVSNLMSDEMLINSYIYTLDNVSLSQYTAIRMGYNARKQQNKLMDFDDMQLYMYSLLVQQNRQDIIEYCKRVYTDFYIDEAQDMSKVQFEILRKLVTDPNKLTLIGDDDQCIYEWRGADPSIILNIGGYYDIERYVLSTNYRCKSNIVNPAAVGIRYNSRRNDKTMVPYKDGGNIKVIDTHGGSLYNQSKYVVEYIRDLVDNKKVDPSNIAILSRNNQHLCVLNNMLFKEGIYSESTPDMRITNTSIYKDIKGLITLVDRDTDPSLTANLLWKLIPFMGLKGARFLADLQKSSGLALRDILGYALKKFKGKTEWKGNVVFPPIVNNRLSQFMSTLKSESVTHLICLYDILISNNVRKNISSIFALYLEGTSFMYKSENSQRALNGISEYIIDLYDNLGMARLKSYLKTSEQFETGKMVVTDSKLTMSTMHGAKGKEWEYVIIFADDNVSFPAFSYIKSLSENIPMSDVYNYIDSERRLHYVAMTRAKTELAIFTDSSNMSIFTMEALGVYKDIESSNGDIVTMAEIGKVASNLIKESEKIVFNPSSVYYHKVELKGLTESTDNTDLEDTRENDTSTNGYVEMPEGIVLGSFDID